jgi:hypothetical protein
MTQKHEENQDDGDNDRSEVASSIHSQEPDEQCKRNNEKYGTDNSVDSFLKSGAG